ncbi:hypothetical protein P5G86_22035 [Paenibacillus jamilae]|uniref:hypothetical protein n=1 Tax=Bacillus cereus group TaxID=86661 RepID=UPI001E2B3CBE|nr:hypothetical protein [Bacillus thuringiensis]MEB4842678.1 hypothetical protein [Paenibacillus jamilae]MEB8835589.1 hypothetical protein [Bacillus cereus]MCR6856278.1 hypothetical protein [Bacillus thuringiensis]MEB9279879.1 hypothetical protein [Bacillus cereus]MEC3036786.1 hypothetical protein [Bacillus cereus]
MDFLDSRFRENTILMYKSIDPNLDFDVNYNFYYDETNNCRKLKIKNGRLNTHKDKDFVLGGVVLEKDNIKNIEVSFDSLKKKLKVQSNLKPFLEEEVIFFNVFTVGKCMILQVGF